MTRKALLIGVPGYDNDLDYLHGVLPDIEGFQDFLISSVGGDWYEHEIDMLINPRKIELLHAIKSIDADYSFIVFAGHGDYVAMDNATHLYMANGEIISEYDLHTTSIRSTIIIDACRQYREGALEEMDFYKSLEGFEGKVQNTRAIFENLLSHCEEGIIKIYSASINQAAGDNREGGHFSQSLLKAGFAWENVNDNKSMLNIFNATKVAEALLKREYRSLQKPEINGGRRNAWFPFAVKDNAFLFDVNKYRF